MHISCLSLLIDSTNNFYKTPTGVDNGKDISEVKIGNNKFLLETIIVAEYFFKKIEFEIRVAENFFKNTNS